MLFLLYSLNIQQNKLINCCLIFFVSLLLVPSPPSNPSVVSNTSSQITFQWIAPQNIATAEYSVRLNSSFWTQTWSAVVNNKTSYMFNNLTSGTKYQFEVRTKAGDLLSDPVSLTAYTGKQLTLNR